MPKGVYKQSYEKTCIVCKTVYVTQCNRSVYCSGTCRNVVWRNQNREKYRLKQQLWTINNPEQHHRNQYEYKKNQLKTDPLAKLRKTLRVRLYSALTKNQKAGSAVRDLGCTIEELKNYLEGKFKEGMNWDNHGEWHIDHIKPLSKFDLSIPEQFKEACHYTNLQPLWAKDNLSKGDTYEI